MMYLANVAPSAIPMSRWRFYLTGIAHAISLTWQEGLRKSRCRLKQISYLGNKMIWQLLFFIFYDSMERKGFSIFYFSFASINDQTPDVCGISRGSADFWPTHVT
jgi:hypothetical protein